MATAPNPATDASVTPSPDDETPRYIPTVAAEVFAPALLSGKLLRKRTAVLLVQDWPNGRYTAADVSLGDGYRFVPLVCSLDGKLAVGVKCGEAMPAKAKVRTAAGLITIARSTKPFHDEAGGQDFAAPYGPECCTYNTCRGNTIPYSAAYPKSRTQRPPTLFAVWPDDADVALEVTTGAVDAAAVTALAPPPKAHVLQAFMRGTRAIASVQSGYGGRLMWLNAAGTRITPGEPSTGPHGYVVLATSDVDGDGNLELVTYALWANDNGVAVFDETSDQPLHDYSCGNI